MGKASTVYCFFGGWEPPSLTVAKEKKVRGVWRNYMLIRMTIGVGRKIDGSGESAEPARGSLSSPPLMLRPPLVPIRLERPLVPACPLVERAGGSSLAQRGWGHEGSFQPWYFC